jgi:hypothetical protein
MRKSLIIIGCLAGTMILGIVFLLAGMNLFGNYFTDAVFLGARGYEAGGNLGFILGISIGIVLSFIVYHRFLKDKSSDR